MEFEIEDRPHPSEWVPEYWAPSTAPAHDMHDGRPSRTHRDRAVPIPEQEACS